MLAWYEDAVWTIERQSQESEKVESRQSLALLLRFAYLRSDLRSILHLESRAARLSSSLSSTKRSASAPAALLKTPRDLEAEGVSIWPEANEDPLRLAFNLKVAYAARDGDWIMVSTFLDQGVSSHLSRSRRSAGSTQKSGAETGLDAIGWGSLLRHGLGDGQRSASAKEHRGKLDQGNNVKKGIASRVTSALSATAVPATEVIQNMQTGDEELLQKSEQRRAQAEAKMSVSKRLLPHLLRYTSAPPVTTTLHSELTGDLSQMEKSTSSSDTSATPAWLLQSVLAQLAERGETATTIRIVQLALSESSGLEHHAGVSGGATTILNLALVACEQNHDVSLTQTLRMFNQLTGSRLGSDINENASIDGIDVCQ